MSEAAAARAATPENMEVGRAAAVSEAVVAPAVDAIGCAAPPKEIVW